VSLPDAGPVYLDTHCMVWLYLGEHLRFTPAARKELESGRQIRISPIVLLELEYLVEIGRVAHQPGAIARSLGSQLDFLVCDVPFVNVIGAAALQNWTNDPFDRIIVGQADAAEAALITADGRIRKHYPRCIW
jgi:PIN domain nuclease of toxin-antitoxin system